MESGYRATVKLQQIWHATNKPHMCVVSYALDSNTFVQVHTQHLDYDKDVALLLETLHIEKKTN